MNNKEILCDTLMKYSKENISKGIKSNFLFEGDNIEVMQMLIKNNIKVKVVYFDAPYNTGTKKYEYKDKFKQDEWEKFMKERLIKAKDILEDSGVIYLSIDSHELSTLKNLCDTVFGKKNFMTLINVYMRPYEKSLNEKAIFANNMEYLLIYCKNRDKVKIRKLRKCIKLENYKYKIRINVENPETLNLGEHKIEIYKKGMYEKIACNDIDDKEILKEEYSSGKKLKNHWTSTYYKKYLQDRRRLDGDDTLYKIYDFGEDGLGYRYIKQPSKNYKNGIYYQGIPTNYREEAEEKGISLGNVEREAPYEDTLDLSIENEIGDKDLSTILGKKYNINPKPIELMEYILNMHDKEVVILDAFAGSGRMGQAILKKNSEDGGNRIFILCQKVEGKESGNICKEITYKYINTIIENNSYNEDLIYCSIDFEHNTNTDI